MIDIFLDSNRVFQDGNEVILEPKCFDLLVYLAERKEKVIHRDRIIGSVWEGDNILDGVVYNSIWKIRRKMGKVIQNRMKVGYIITEDIKIHYEDS